MNVARSLSSALLLLPGLALGGDAMAAELEPGVRYEGQTRIVSSEYGASFVLPRGWSGVLPPEGEFFVMENEVLQAYVFASMGEMTVASAKETMGQPIDLGDGIVLRLQGTLRVEGSVLSGSYTVSGADQPLVGLVTTVVGKHGWGISFLGASSAESAARLAKEVEGMRRSLTLKRPKRSRPAPSAKGGSPWTEHISGRKLSYLFTRSGYTEEDYLWLCPDGRFLKSAQGGGFGGGASGAFASSNAGRWSVAGALQSGTLVLTFNDSSVARHTLTHEGTKLFLDGKRYYRETADCR